MRKSGPRPSQKEQYKNLDGIREASSEGGEAPPKGGLEGRLVKYRLTRWGVGDPRALFTLRESRRGRLEVCMLEKPCH